MRIENEEYVISEYSIALKESRETQYWLRLLNACELISTDRLTPMIQEANEITAILRAIVKNREFEEC